jgi:hypothetical protein
LNVVTKCDKDGRVRVGVMNTAMEAIVILVGTKYGSFSRIVDVAQNSEHPFCVAVINSAEGLHPLGQEEVSEPEKRKKTTAKKKTAQETESADQTGPELAPWLVGPTTAANTLAQIAHLISVFKLRDSPLLDTDAKLAQAAYMPLKHRACFSFDGNYNFLCVSLTEGHKKPSLQRLDSATKRPLLGKNQTI